MTLRLGFVGTGKWARKLAESFRACGAEIVAYNRGSGRQRSRCPYGCTNGYEGNLQAGTQVRCPQGCDAGWEYSDPTGFGKFMPWRDQIADKSIDAIVAVAPPEVTTEIVLACGEAGKAIMGTKPLWNVPDTIRAPAHVDFWRLWTFGHRATKEAWEKDPSKELLCNLYGDGPFRDFPGSLDYGPHVMAALLDIQPGLTVKSAKKLNGGNGELFRVEFGPGNIVANFGNAGQGRGDRRLAYGDTEWIEAGEQSWGMRKDDALRAMCRAFIADCHEGYGDTRLMDLSREGMRMLREIREVAK